MSLNKTLDRLFDEIRREARRNPDFADRLDAVLRLHGSRREVSDGLIENMASEPQAAGEPDAVSGPKPARLAPAPGAKRAVKSSSEATSAEAPAPQVSPAPGPGAQVSTAQGAPSPKPGASRRMLELLNPVGLYKREGEEALAAMLAKANLETLRALIVEHDLDPSGQTEALDRESLAAHVIAHAKRRAERDEKMFDY